MHCFQLAYSEILHEFTWFSASAHESLGGLPSQLKEYDCEHNTEAYKLSVSLFCADFFKNIFFLKETFITYEVVLDVPVCNLLSNINYFVPW